MSDQAGSSEQEIWLTNNDQHLGAIVHWVHLRLEQLVHFNNVSPQENAATKDASRTGIRSDEASSAQSTQCSNNKALALARQAISELEQNTPPPALAMLSHTFALSEFDQCLLALCAAMEFNSRTAELCALAQGDVNKPYPTFALAFLLFDNPDWGALSPHAPLRHWRLLGINQTHPQTLTNAPIAMDERIVNYLKGLNYLDARLTPLVDPINVSQQARDVALPPSQQVRFNQIITALQSPNQYETKPAIELLGHSSDSKRLLAAQVASALKLNLHVLNLKILPGDINEFDAFSRLWERECLLLPIALYIDAVDATDAEKIILQRFLLRCPGVMFMDTGESKIELSFNRFSVEIKKPTPDEQRALWKKALQPAEDNPEVQARRLSEQFSFSQKDINQLAHTRLKTASQEAPLLTNDFSVMNTTSTLSPNPNDLWDSCRIFARTGMEQLAQRIDIKATWEQLVLPPEQKHLLYQITDQVLQRNRVYEDWGFRSKMNRGLGISALFSGESGTGKTMAAEVIANALSLDLYRIDLSSVVSKYIGETEKNLRKLFDTAEDSGAIIFFDEADALFGKRGEVKDSHDRYANIEINYLLQRMETYRGLAILATNMKSSLDKAFLRRLRFIVEFPFPGIRERTQMWHKVFPTETPLAPHFDCGRLAKLNLTGGNIHNVALNAAFMAAKQGTVVTMPLILEAAQLEFKKLERPAKDTDFCWNNKLEVTA